jgi:superoxide dismutase, Cu-Zn family
MMNVRGMVTIVSILMAGCTTVPPGSASDPIASATLRNAAGAAIGSASLSENGDGLSLVASASGLTPGSHGIHLHAVGRCDAPDFASAGGHLNPTARHHGLDNPQGSHAGDMPNLQVAASGTGSLRSRVMARAADVFDADGTAIVIHAAADDQRTDPSGNSGGRVACGVIARP